MTRGLITGAVRALEALTPAVTCLDLGGLSWRRLRAFQRGTTCLADCGEGHTYGVWCQMGWAWPNQDWLLHAVSLALFPYPPTLQSVVESELRGLDDILVRSHEQVTELTLYGELWQDERGNRVDPPVDRVLPSCDRHPGRENHCASGACGACWLCRARHAPGCASIEDAEGKAGPCDCWAAQLTGPQRVRAKLREQGLATTGGDSPEWRLPEDWRGLTSGVTEALERAVSGAVAGLDDPGPHPWDAEVARRVAEGLCGLCGQGPHIELEAWGQPPRPYFGASCDDVDLHHDGRSWVEVYPGGPRVSCYEAWTIYGLRPEVGDWRLMAAAAHEDENEEHERG